MPFFLIVGICAVGFVVYLLWPTEPSYQGRTLGSWLMDLRWDGGSNPRHDAAVAALRRMGTNAFPPLVRMLDARDSHFKSKLMDAFEEQSVVHSPFVTAETFQQRALAAFRSLGPDARGAIPLLVELVQRPEPNEDAVQALIYIGPDAVPSLNAALAGQDAGLRCLMIEHVGAQRDSYPALVPVLVHFLRDDNRNVRWNCAMFLGLHPVAPEAVVPALADRLADGDARVRQVAAQSLENHGPSAKSAVPALLKALDDPDGSARKAATNALQAIDPEAMNLKPAPPRRL